MTRERQTSREAQFKPYSIVQLLVFYAVGILFGTLLASGFWLGFLDLSGSDPSDPLSSLSSGSDPLSSLLQGIGRFTQLALVFGLVGRLVSVIRTGITRPGSSLLELVQDSFPGQFIGACPYCGATNKVDVSYPTQLVGKDCPRCKNRFVIENMRFYQLPSPRRLPREFSGTKNGIHLVGTGVILAFWVLSASLFYLLLSSVTTLIPIPTPILPTVIIFLFSTIGILGLVILVMFISTVIQTIGVWLCLQTPDRVPAKAWIGATVSLQGITFILLIGKFLFQAPLWFDPLLQISGLISQFTFITFLIKLCDFLQRADLSSEFDSYLQTALIILVGLVLLKPIVPSSYDMPLLLALFLVGLGVLFRYWQSLKRLETHLSQALNSRT